MAAGGGNLGGVCCNRRMSGEPIVSLEHVTRRFGARSVLCDLDLVLSGGERLGVLGDNGAGKTTLLRLIAGTLTPSAGCVRVGDALAGSPAAKRQLGVALTQGRGFYGRLSGHENLLLFARLRLPRRAAPRAVAELIGELELQEIAAVRVDRCSAGMLGQLTIARALLGDPRALLLDEPTRSLDAGAQARLWGALSRRPQLAALITTHQPRDLAHCTASIRLSAQR